MPVLCEQQIAEREFFEKCSVKDLRRQAALRNVPLQHIASALEKTDLVKLCMNAGPPKDQYDVSTRGKVWTAESIANSETMPKKPKEKKSKKKKRKSSSSSSRSSSSGKKKKRSRSRKAIKGRKKKSRSSSLEMIIPTITIGRKEKAVFEIADTSQVSVPSAIIAPTAKAAAAVAARAKAAAEAAAPEPSEAHKGMAAAAAMGYDVLPKAAKTRLQAPPMEGLRPSNPLLQERSVLGLRVCMRYLIKAGCPLGENCTERHITDPDEEMQVRSKFKTLECNYGANCTKDGCLYRHPSEIMEEYKPGVASGQGIALMNVNGQLQMTWQ